MQTDEHEEAKGSYCDYINAPKNEPSYI